MLGKVRTRDLTGPWHIKSSDVQHRGDVGHAHL